MELKWIKWWEGSFVGDTEITKISVEADGIVHTHYILMPVLKAPEGAPMALTALAINQEKFGGTEEEIIAYLLDKKKQFERTLSYGEYTPNETKVSVLDKGFPKAKLFLKEN